MIILELALRDKDAMEVSRFIRREALYALVRNLDEEDDILYLMCHGDQDGELIMGLVTFTLEEIAHKLIKVLKEQYGDVTTVYTVCCYGGMQKECCVDGVTFRSAHNEKDKVVGRLHAGTFTLETDVGQVQRPKVSTMTF